LALILSRFSSIFFYDSRSCIRINDVKNLSINQSKFLQSHTWAQGEAPHPSTATASGQQTLRYESINRNQSPHKVRVTHGHTRRGHTSQLSHTGQQPRQAHDRSDAYRPRRKSVDPSQNWPMLAACSGSLRCLLTDTTKHSPNTAVRANTTLQVTRPPHRAAC